MEIFIDGQKADFKLENETNLFEVVGEVERWARQNGRFLRRFTAGEKSWYGSDESLKSVPLEGLNEVAFETILPADLAREALGDVLVFFRKLSSSTEEKMASLTDLSETLQWCSNVAAKARVILKLDTAVKVPGCDLTIGDWLARLEEAARTAQNDPSVPAFRVVKGLDPTVGAAAIEALLASAAAAAEPQVSRQEIGRKLQAGRLEIPELVDRIASLTERLHAGKDQEAMNELTDISGSMTSIIKTLQQADILLPAGFSALPLEGGSSVAEELAVLTDVFKRIITAFDGRDIVLLCDLLEYELSPRLVTLDKVLALLQTEIKSDFN